MKFNLPKDQSSIIKVIGVGGGGSNAVNYMYSQGIKGVDFIVCNTDQQALDISPVPTKIQLGASLTEGRGAGSLPDVGKNAALENLEEIRDILSKNTQMVFITAGMGGGTGTGAAPVIAATAKEMGILTVGIVTIPFAFEGRKRKQQAENGIEEMRRSVDTLIIVCNDRIREMYGNLTITNAFSHADDVLSIAAKGIAEIITVTGSINVDFEDVRTVMTNSGVAIMGSATAEGENRAIVAVEKALNSPLLNDNNIEGANHVLLNITYGSEEIQMDEVVEVTDFIQEASGGTADVIWGHGHDAALGNQISVTIIATGFKSKTDFGYHFDKKPEKKFMRLEEDKPSVPHKTVLEADKPSTPENTWTESKPTMTEPKEAEEEPFLRADSPSFSATENTNAWENNQRTIEFDMTEKTRMSSYETPSSFEPYMKKTDLNTSSSTTKVTQVTSTLEATITEKEISTEPQQDVIKERVSRLKELSLKLKAPSGLAELENEPAYQRRKIKLDDTPASNEQKMSKYTLSEEEDPATGEKKYNIRENNSFLHDNVD
jgi:cell division protein FtsZ